MWRVYKRGEIYWIDAAANGQRVRKSSKSKDKKTAEGIARLTESKLLGTYHEPKDETLGKSVYSLIAEKKRTKSAGTLDFYHTKLGHLIRLWGEHSMLSTIDARKVDAYVSRRREEGAKSNTIAKELIVLRQLLKHARRREEYERDPSAVLPVGFSSGYKPKENHLTPEQAEGLLTTLEGTAPHTAAWVAMALASGARRAEMARIRRSDVSLDDNTILIRGTKTSLSHARIPIVSMLRPLVEYALTHGRKDERFLPAWSTARDHIAEACRKHGLKITPNDLRRTCATWLAQSGVPLEHVAKMLRHSDTRMVTMVYAKVGPQALGALIDAVPKLYQNDQNQQTSQTSQNTNSPVKFVPRVRIELTTPGFSVLEGQQENTEKTEVLRATVPILYLDRYIARKVEGLQKSKRLAQALRNGLTAAYAADEAGVTSALIKASRLLGAA